MHTTFCGDREVCNKVAVKKWYMLLDKGGNRQMPAERRGSEAIDHSRKVAVEREA